MGASGANFAAMMLANNQLSAGRSQVPVLNAGVSQAVRVELKPPMPDTSFQSAGFLVGGLSLLGALEVQGPPVVVDASHVDVTVENTGLLQLSGAFVTAIAIRD